MVVINKIDIPEVAAELDAKLDALRKACGIEPLAISGVSTQGIQELLDRVLPLIPDDVDVEPEAPPVPEAVVKPPRRERVTVDRDEDVYVVRCRQAERFCTRSVRPTGPGFRILKRPSTKTPRCSCEPTRATFVLSASPKRST